ncbi:TPA: chloride channel protein [Neisseria meningitidis]|uniref:chloride channel protein n=1 Tax=Neisseria meningitidis TaxID=487 RepID=UPI000766B556|nr:chloride channel protein [Neisseria meningitidis]MBG8581171.1 chloride channel protein [Neisseria meningitidis]MBG8669847.1 chloride channel protein [Neisseria meningitidis]MBG8738560.1 chloride channel protein [Neisseria meningitidis]MBJ7763558.1 chloride channel protein [Neisseria meningitidis]MBR7235248.1 chloride channel protein EriC [Neisseria meningitidis]
MTSTFPRRLARKIRQTRRLSRKSIAFVFLLAGSALVALTALFFAHLADFALELNAKLVQQYPWFAWVALPLGLPLIAWLTRKFAPFTAGSGIPQVIASLSLPYGAQKTRLIRLKPTLLKIPLTFLGMLFGASIGREGPSVQVGAAVMGAWGAWCKKHGLAFKGMQENDLMAAGAAGGLAAAFNAPLAGVIFAIEELGRGIMLRWERQILLGVLASGFIQVAIQGNNPYFSGFNGGVLEHIFLWVALSGLVCGAAGGLFGRLLYRGAAAFAPRKIRGFIRNRPLLLAALMGLLLALLGTFYQGKTYGTGYHEAAQALHGIYEAPFGLAAAKWLATVFSYWAGVPGGIFTPSLTIGAVLGEHIAAIADISQGANIIVLICMAAFLAGATQSPITSAVVVMEMTGGQSLLFWMLIACIFASQVSRQFSPRPFYHASGMRFRQRVLQETAAQTGNAPARPQTANSKTGMPSEN